MFTNNRLKQIPNLLLIMRYSSIKYNFESIFTDNEKSIDRTIEVVRVVRVHTFSRLYSVQIMPS